MYQVEWIFKLFRVAFCKLATMILTKADLDKSEPSLIITTGIRLPRTYKKVIVINTRDKVVI